jgi:hypothetical protein
MLKNAERIQAERFYDEVLVALSPFRTQPPNPNPRLTAPEYVRPRLVAYALRSQQLETILQKLGAKEFCALRCERRPDGCCWEYGYRMGNEDFFEFLELQEVESGRRGWTAPGKRCWYHSRYGCRLSLFKGPVCLRLLCPALVRSLCKRFGHEASLFNETLANLSLDIRRSPSLLAEMDRAIAAGNRLLNGTS